MQQFHARLAECAAAVQARLDDEIGRFPGGDLRDAMLHACRGGKRLRAFLVMESARLHGVSDEVSLPAAAAVEALHAYSLVHDDLPCMDDDDMRRGCPTVHVKWDEATAVLVGDALQSMAFALVAADENRVDPSIRLELVRSLAKASGAGGMVLGQMKDIAAETSEQPLSLEEITELQALKTGALIEWSGVAGPILASADTTPMRHYSRALGLAFQIADDILDVVGDANKAGKRVGKDAGAGKATFVSLLGLDGARERAATLVEQAERALAPFGDLADTLRQAARFVISREV